MMKCKVCNVELFDTKSGKQPLAYMGMGGADGTRCKEHKDQ